MDFPHFGQFIVWFVGWVIVVPHSGQNFEVAGTCAPHFGHITRAAAGACTGPLGVMTCGMSTMPVPKPAPPDDFPRDSAALLTVSIRSTSLELVPPVLSQKSLSRYSGVVSIPSKRRSVSSRPTRLVVHDRVLHDHRCFVKLCEHCQQVVM